MGKPLSLAKDLIMQICTSFFRAPGRLLVAMAFFTSCVAWSANPIIDEAFTADPAALVDGDTVYLYTGHDVAPNNDKFFEMHDWLAYSSRDMKTWQSHGPILKATDFKWAKGDAWASHMIKHRGRYYFFVTVRHNEQKPGFAIGLAVADSPLGPFKDALGHALINNEMTQHTRNDWDDIDPAVFIDSDDQAYLFFGNLVPKMVKLSKDLRSLAGPIEVLDLPRFTEASWLHKHKEWYYLSYACDFPEKICYSRSKSIQGPWQFEGILNEVAGNSETNHQAIIEFKGNSYFIYHNGVLPPVNGQPSGGRFRRSVAIERLYYLPDGRMQPVMMTSAGVQ